MRAIEACNIRKENHCFRTILKINYISIWRLYRTILGNHSYKRTEMNTSFAVILELLFFSVIISRQRCESRIAINAHLCNTYFRFFRNEVKCTETVFRLSVILSVSESLMRQKRMDRDTGIDFSTFCLKF